MCGIVGYIGKKSAESVLLEGLKRLEYRGYDSAGIATLSAGKSYLRRAVGKLNSLSDLLKEKPCKGSIGIAHTRWASHGRPSEQNAHPHQFGPITVVHNGIIENHSLLKKELISLGHQFKSDTDSEIAAHLIARYKQEFPNDFQKAVQKALERIEGAYALAILDADTPDTLIGVKQACPLVVGLGEDEQFLASDFPAVLSHTRRFFVLEDGEMAVLKKDTIQVFDLTGAVCHPKEIKLDWSPAIAEKGGYKHFMLKEIFEQPQAIIDTLRGRYSPDEIELAFDTINTKMLCSAKRITFVACGTSYHAALIGKRYIEEFAKIPVEVDLASEFRYRNPIIEKDHLIIGVSQSGETADTLAALKLSQTHGAKTMAVCNVIESAIPRLCNKSAGTFYTYAGPEISVASTKAFLTQIVALYFIAIYLGKQNKTLSNSQVEKYLQDLYELPMLLEKTLLHEPKIKEIAKNLSHHQHLLIMGRGYLYTVALEGALKVKELSYIHAEGYAAGEMKHGPIALIDENMLVLVLAPNDNCYTKTLSNLEEIKSRGAQIAVLCQENNEELKNKFENALLIPECPEHLLPAISVLPLQLLSYHLSNWRGLDVDQPRNLAKSVTIE